MKQLPLLLLLFLVSSCTTYKNVAYFQTDKENQDSIFHPAYQLYRLQPGDQLYVNLKSGNSEIDEQFNLFSSSGGNTVGQNFFVTGFSVSEQGFIDLPVLGQLLVSGMTVDSCRLAILEQAQNFMQNPHVKVKLVSFKVSLLGEAKGGQIKVMYDKASIFEVLALGGDITWNGNKRKVLIVRQELKGLKTIEIDLSSKDILKSPYFYVMPNDVIYVPPRKPAVLKASVQEYLMVISTITSTLSFVLLITKLL